MSKSLKKSLNQYKKNNVPKKHQEKPWEQKNSHKINCVDTHGKQRLNKHFPERFWGINNENKKGPKI